MIAASVWYRAAARAGTALSEVLIATLMVASVAGGVAWAGQATEGAAAGQAGWLQPVPAFPLASDAATGNLTIRRHAEALKPLTVAGKCGAFVGQQDGSFEAWTWPLKLLSHFRIEAHLEDYSIPIDVNEQAAEVEVAPDRTTITFAHAAFTIREILFATQCQANGAGVMALFQVDSTRPMTLTFNFTPEVKRMWPAENPNAPSPEWVKLAPDAPGGRVNAAGGYYLLHTDFPTLAGVIAMPGTEPGILAPYQERPKNWPLQLILHYDPKRDGSRYFPLLMAAGDTEANASSAHLVSELERLNRQAAALYGETAAYYEHFFDKRLTAETPDARVNEALRWAEISIDQLRVQHGSEVGLVAGLYSSGDSTRPGFGWFFGRDSLYTLYAVDSYGDFALAREELEFLLKRQRADGKIMHEFSQTAEDVDWLRFPYQYAAADATPLFLMVINDYLQASGDRAFVTEHWAEVQKAWQFETTHDADGDGIYDNAQGTGWVESWIPAMPKQEVYLAALDVQASQAYAAMARVLGHGEGVEPGRATAFGKEEEAARARAVKTAATLAREYLMEGQLNGAAGPAESMYAFSRNAGASPTPAAGEAALLDRTATIYPAIAWWDGGYALKDPDAMFRAWASHEFSTDWGTRDVGEGQAIYDPMSYHQGSVWPLFTGWASVAEYRTGRPLSGYAHLMQNLDLTWAQDLGAVTELLSGQYFEPFGRSTTHQLWSSAMVLVPAIRGLFGVTVTGSVVNVDPHLPAAWEQATLRHVPVHGGMVDLEFRREGGVIRVLMSGGGPGVELAARSTPGGGVPPARGAAKGELRIPLPGVEIGIPDELPLPGARTAQLKVLEQHAEAHSARWLFEAQGGSEYRLPLRRNGVRDVHAEGATVESAEPTTAAGMAAAKAGAAMETLVVHFPAGSGYVRHAVEVHW